MPEVKKDLRIQRTRKLIMDSFIDLSGKKEFRDITVKDITTEAMINRATFYYHFDDIYDLLEKALSEVLMVNLEGAQFESSTLDEGTFIKLFTAITDFQLSLSRRCHRGYEETIARIIREQLEVVLYGMLIKDHEELPELKTVAVMLSWALYGASVDWKNNYADQSPEAYIERVIPYLISSVNIS